MKKKIFICLSIIIFIIGIISIIKYNKYKEKLNYTLEQVGEENYFLLMQNNKYGVISKNGDIIIDPIYDVIEVPNPSKPIFICKSNYNTETKEYNIQVFDESKNQILYQYYIVEAIKLNNVEDNGNYEKSVLKYKSENKYGLIDFNGNKITEAIYDSIEGFEYKEGLLLVKRKGKFGIININGVSIIKEKYDEILCDGYYTKDSRYNKSGYIVGTKSDNGMRYGYINYNRKQILKNEFNEIYRITDKIDDDNVYLVAFKDGKAGVYENKKNIIKNEYEDILYNSTNDLLTLQKSSKQGVSKFDGTTIVPIEYDNIFFAGNYINAQKSSDVDIYDTNGVKEENSEYISKQSFNDNKYEIVSTSKDEYKIENNEKGLVISNGYTYIQYLFDNYFCSTKDNKSGIIDDEGNVICDFKYNVIQMVDGYNIIQLLDDNNNTEILNSKLDSVIKAKSVNIYMNDNYLKIQSENDIQYLDRNGNKIENTSIFTNSKLFAFKEKSKWGFKDKEGNTIVAPKYEMVTEFNNYGFAGIKSNGKWGVINQDGTIVKEPTYEINQVMEPSFIKEYYKVDLGYGEPYYTNE
ncbi:MAG: WG repeat-containing protein [Clostridia bacterium]|nr:WG repeat-containing protein [Clostridia bacterium]